MNSRKELAWLLAVLTRVEGVIGLLTLGVIILPPPSQLLAWTLPLSLTICSVRSITLCPQPTVHLNNKVLSLKHPKGGKVGGKLRTRLGSCWKFVFLAAARLLVLLYITKHDRLVNKCSL